MERGEGEEGVAVEREVSKDKQPDRTRLGFIWGGGGRANTLEGTSAFEEHPGFPALLPHPLLCLIRWASSGRTRSLLSGLHCEKEAALCSVWRCTVRVRRGGSGLADNPQILF